MRNKKFFVGAAVAAALLIHFPKVSADDVETFGEDFEDESISEVIPFQDENEDLGPILIFNDPDSNSSKTPPVTEETPVTENPVKINPIVIEPVVTEPVADEPVVIEPTPRRIERERILPPSRIEERRTEIEKRKRLKTQKVRFIKLAIDDDYTYYLDKESIAWKRIPYSASEYMLDVWVRMIERNPDNSDLSEDLSDYINDEFNGEIAVAKERGRTFAPTDVEVLQHKKYFLEHYYLRPKTSQIQFLSELEVVGQPQNTVSERDYEYKNWENLIPGSIESIIYKMTMKEVGKSGSSEKGHMSLADKIDEYLRISIR